MRVLSLLHHRTLTQLQITLTTFPIIHCTHTAVHVNHACTCSLSSNHPHRVKLDEELRDLGLLRRPTPSPTPTTASRPQRRCYKRRERKQKRGKRGGIRARLAANPHKPVIPIIVLANVRSLDNKLDYIQLLRSTQRTVRDCCVFVFTETWLSNSVPDCTIQLDQLTCYQADRALVEVGKRCGGGLCVYINNVWRRDAVVVCKHCSPLVEFMIIKCRPFYLPREYTAILLVAVYIPPSSTNNNNRSEVLNDLYQHISEQQTAFLILAGDFNHADLRSVFPKIHQHVIPWILFTPYREELTRPSHSPTLEPQTTSLSC